MILLLIEVDRGRVYLEAAFPSLFEFCVRKLRMSEGEAFRRINAARLVARFPALLGYIERRDIHLSALVQLRDYFTAENVDDLVAATRGRNKMEIAEHIARLAPRADVPAKLRKLPQHDGRTHMTKASRPSIDPLSEERYRLQMTGSRRFRDKVLRARDLMMHTNPTGDLAVVVERAVDELLDVLEKRVFGKLSRKPADGSHSTEPSAEAPSESSSVEARSSKKKTGGAGRPGLARTSTESNGKAQDPNAQRSLEPNRMNRAPHLRQRMSRKRKPGVQAQERPVGHVRSG
jgi:hypothetical protein